MSDENCTKNLELMAVLDLCSHTRHALPEIEEVIVAARKYKVIFGGISYDDAALVWFYTNDETVADALMAACRNWKRSLMSITPVGAMSANPGERRS
jgi:hypothetical protein